jgi:hypothetical protein
VEKLVVIGASLFGAGRIFKIFFNLSPMYRRTGGRLVNVSDDLKYVKIKLPLNYRTRNYVGTLYGGHMYSCVDGIYMVQLIRILGKEYVVWDKSATIKFKRPGDRTLYAEFIISDDLLEQIKSEISELNEKDYHLMVDLTDADGNVYANVEKVIYIADKKFYLAKKKAQFKNSKTNK